VASKRLQHQECLVEKLLITTKPVVFIQIIFCRQVMQKLRQQKVSTWAMCFAFISSAITNEACQPSFRPNISSKPSSE